MNIDVVVDESIYPLECVMSTAYVFIDRCYVLLDKVPEGVKISLSPKPSTTGDEIQAIAGDFQNELLGQALRMRIAQRHEKVRETIVARALFGAAPRISEFAPNETAVAPSDEQIGVEAQFVPQANDEYLDDPLGIAVPWEEKYGKASGDDASGAAPSGTSAGTSTGTREDPGSKGGQTA